MTKQEMIEAIKNGDIKKNLINGEKNDSELAWGTHFAQSIYNASNFFYSYLWLGGSYVYNTDDKKVIAERLHDIVEILGKYEQ